MKAIRYKITVFFVLVFVVSMAGSVYSYQVGRTGLTLVINEFMASNNSVVQDPQGHYEDWIEIYNYGANAIDIGGMYLTDNLDMPTKWQISGNNPSVTTIGAGDYLLIWADDDAGDSGLHTNFKLSASGEEIGLFESDGTTLIDSIEFDEQIADVSYGRNPDASNSWFFLGSPSPGEQNGGAILGKVADTKFSVDRGFYEEPFSVEITSETVEATIRYTTDGSSPSRTHGNVYAGPITIDKTTCLRAMAFREGWLATNVDTHTYIFLSDVIEQPERPEGYPTNWGHAGADYGMDPVVVNAYSDTIKGDMKSVPTVSLVMDKDDWFGSRGIYINQSQDGTERVVSMEYIDPNSGDGFQVNCAISMQGGVSGGGTSLNRWKSDKLSMRPRFKTTTDDEIPTGGPSKLNYKVFEDSDVEVFDTLVLDARLGNAWNYGGSVTDSGSRPWISGRPIYQPDIAQYTRDQFVADIQNALGGYSHHGRHIHLYINGLYWGLYNLHERPDHRFAASYFGGDADDYDCLKHSRNMVINGSNSTFNEMLNIAESGLASNEQYRLIQQYLDIPNFIDYLLPNYYVGNYDWGHKNWYATRNSSDPNGRWRFHHWDGEHLMESLTQNVTGRDNAGGPTRIHYRLLQNAEYRLLFADHVHRHFFNDGSLTPEGATALYQVRLDDVDRAVVGESARWGDNQIDRFAHIRYMRDPHWLLERDWILGTYIPSRTDIVVDQFKARGWYPNIDAPVFYVDGSYQHGGYVASANTISMVTTDGAVWYTLDGNDPRLPSVSSEPSDQLTLVPGNAPKRVVVPINPISDSWRGGGTFNDSTWELVTGSPGGVGYERSAGYENYISFDIESQMYNENTTCYIRIPFTIDDDLTQFNSMILRMRYDDGFIAYLNGVEVARTNFTGTPSWDSNADAGHEADGVESFFISDYLNALRNGQNILAIQGLNLSLTSSDFIIAAELVLEMGNDDPGNDIISSSARQYTGPITLPHSVHIKARTLNGSTWSALNEATFAVGPVAENLRITEIMYRPYNPSDASEPDEEYIELKNVGTQAINLNLVKFTNGIDFTFGGVELAPGEYIVVVQDVDAFKARYGQNVNVAGQYSGRLNNAGERIRLEDAAGQVILNFRFKDGWHPSTDGDGYSLTIIDPTNGDSDSWNDKDSWRASTSIGGSPGTGD